MPKFSFIVPVYNRAAELEELLHSLTLLETSEHGSFEVIIVEDGSAFPATEVVEKYLSSLDLHYYTKPNEGPGPTRNYGAQYAKGVYLVFLDSDVTLPSHYISAVNSALSDNKLDAWGGPDKAHPNFLPIQQAINYSMTSWLTTGGIRGKKQGIGTYHPRSFNMGIMSTAFQEVGGFSTMRFGEDLDLSMRLIEGGFKAILIPEAWVYHKRRTSWKGFFNQIHNSGIARINLYKRHPGTLKAVHALPAMLVLFALFALLLGMAGYFLPLIILLVYFLAIGIDALRSTSSMVVALNCIVATAVQHSAYGTGFLIAVWKRLVLGQGEFDKRKGYK